MKKFEQENYSKQDLAIIDLLILRWTARFKQPKFTTT